MGAIPEEYAIIGPIISIFSILLESFFIYYLFSKIKKIETRKLPFFIGIVISFALSGYIISFNYDLQIYQHIIFNIFCFITAKLLYKEKIPTEVGQHIFNIDVSKYLSGSYLIRINYGEITRMLNIIIIQ